MSRTATRRLRRRKRSVSHVRFDRSETGILTPSRVPEDRHARRCRRDSGREQYAEAQDSSAESRLAGQSGSTPIMTAETEAHRLRRCPGHGRRRARRFRFHGRCLEVARVRLRLFESRARVSVACTSRSSTMAATNRPSSSPARTRSRRLRWRTAISRPRASRSLSWPTARSVCSMPRWRSTTPGATAFLFTSSSVITATLRCAAPPSGITVCRMLPTWCAITRSGTTILGRWDTSPSRPCAPTKSR